jgi:hypothetical protein
MFKLIRTLYSVSLQLIPRSGPLLKKLTVAELIKKFAAFYEI